MHKPCEPGRTEDEAESAATPGEPQPARSRRHFLTGAGAGAAAALMSGVRSASAQGAGAPAAREPATPFVPEELPPHLAETERQSPHLRPPCRRRSASVTPSPGSGGSPSRSFYPPSAGANGAASSRSCRGSAPRPSGAQRSTESLRVRCSYEDFDRIAENPAVEVVYVALPDGLHEAFSLRAARAGKHVLCEKPMANTSARIRRMITACDEASRKLMIAYRIQYEPYNRTARALVRGGAYGKAKVLEAADLQNWSSEPQWRFDKALAGGGALPDIGIYCLSTVRSS